MTSTDFSPSITPNFLRKVARSGPTLLVTLVLGVAIGLLAANTSEAARNAAPTVPPMPTPDWHGNVRASGYGQ